jgi:transcriptional regulator with XRE-family HTH domain
MERDLHTRFGAAVQRSREEAGISIGTLANLTGIKPDDLMKLEKGESDPPLEMMFAVARGIGVWPSRLLKAAENERAP